MDTENIPPVPAADLAVGDRIAAGFVPGHHYPAEVRWTDTYKLRARRWTFVAYRVTDGPQTGDVESTHFMADALIRLDARADDGLSYSREADDPTPVSPARVPLHTGAMTDGGLVDETEPPKLVTAERAREIVEAGGAVHRDERYSGDYRYIVDSMGALAPSPVGALPSPGVLEVADGHVVHECCGKLDDAPHQNFCKHYRPVLATADCSHRDDPGHDEHVHADECLPKHARNEAPVPVGKAECGCPVFPFPQGRGDGADTIVDHRADCIVGPY